MKKDTFIKHLEAVPARVVPFTRKYVVNPLPDKVQYLLYPNRSGGRAVLHQDEAIFPEESLAKGKATKPDTSLHHKSLKSCGATAKSRNG